MCVWLVRSILGGGQHHWALLAYHHWHWGEGDSDGNSQVYPAYICGKEQHPANKLVVFILYFIATYTTGMPHLKIKD